MSSTTETITQTRTARTILQDYQLHHSGAAEPSSSNSNGAGPARMSNPPDWPTNARRIPPYRPVDQNRDHSQIRVYTSGIERAFIITMFTGVFINATAAKQWRRTGGRFTKRIFRYPIGGEF
ncbi:hypothetical protein SAPIO_CDS4760 [Scedosporium apiospermum]|uniref:Uncharacterized protein n=1 Tax=Pseudallescheria apiosperma TaxID=563466 RepID=A0A084G7K3_PSEDA|nr:uncharacterized protein SAPIO_CDS4760 [Scedosporium apiospermum]KEZ43315.1 hypothetical protein SAPIO_CDS4760 [Scedosporium apiospermum]